MNPKDLYNMTNDELVNLIKKQKRNIQQRMKRLENSKGGTYSPSYQRTKKEKLANQKVPDFNKSEDIEYTREQAIKQAEKNARRLKSKTFTPKGWEKTRNNFQNIIGEKMSARTEKKFWKVYNEIMDEYPELSQAVRKKIKDSFELMKEMFDIYKSRDRRRSASEIVKDIRKVLDNEYEKTQQEKLSQEESSEYYTHFKSTY